MSDTTKAATVTFTYRPDRGGYMCSEPGDMDGQYVRVPADDDTPWDIEWLKAVGFDAWADAVIAAQTRTRLRSKYRGPCLEFCRDGRVKVNGSDVPCTTRGEVRRLCRAIGHKLKESR